MRDYVDFERNFKELIEKHKNDKDYNLIKDYPEIFSTVMSIAADKSTISDGIAKMLMNSAISYFVLLNDIIPEKEGGIKGYIDDFFVCICVLYKLIEYDKKLGEYLIRKYWKIEEDYERYILKKYYELSKQMGHDISSEVALSSGIDYIDCLILSKKHPKTYSENKIADLQRKLYYMFFILLKKPLVGREEKRNFENQFFGTEEFREFAKKIELLSKTDNEFLIANDQINEMFDIEKKLRQIKAKRLLK